jgi:cell wall-associated NlpC family hydrolase
MSTMIRKLLLLSLLLFPFSFGAAQSGFTFSKYKNPDRTEVRDSTNHWIATFTNNSYTVTLSGPARNFSERTAGYSVTHSTWVRTLPTPFTGKVDQNWLNQARTANQNLVADVLALGMQYIEAAPIIIQGSLQIAGDSSYGPLQSDGTRQEGSDFNDYLGITWNYSDGTHDSPESAQKFCLDCSGFMRMIFGYRHSFANAAYKDQIPLCISPRTDRAAMPRRSFEIYASAPGTLIITNTGKQITDFSKINIGDLVFFDADAGDGTQIDHVGMYLGIDSGGNYRFISSRKSIDGPTLGDYNGKSVLNGTGLYATSFRGARRM